jgi:hypothetical protein
MAYKPPNKTIANLGDKLVTADYPVWHPPGVTGIPISDIHAPCGYWFKDRTASTNPPPIYRGIYASVAGLDIYLQSAGFGNFNPIGADYRLWIAMTASPQGDVYACVTNGDIYKQSGGSGAFLPLGQAALPWRAMCSAPNGDVYASTYGGSPSDIYKQTGGVGNFVALGAPNISWHGLAADLAGNIYACEINGTMYKQTNGAGAWNIIASGLSNCYSMCITYTDDLYYANINNYKIYKQTGLTGAFVQQTVEGSPSAITWTGMAAAPNGDVYACTNNNPGKIYKQTGGVGTFMDLHVNTYAWSDICAVFS